MTIRIVRSEVKRKDLERLGRDASLVKIEILELRLTYGDVSA